jgi:hypothetical protein
MRFKSRSTLGALVLALAICGLTAASALAAGAPTAETRPALKNSPYEYYLAGYVNPNGVETKLYFEYGTTISYGSKTKETTTTVAHEALKLVTELAPNAAYHFRVVATNSFGTSYGADEVFTTPVEPEAVSPEGKITELKFSAGSAAAYVEWGGAKVLNCSGSNFTGQFINSRELEGTMTWHRCHQETSECTNGKEQVQSEPLKGKLGYINRTKKEVGLLLTGKSSEIWANNVSCLGLGKQPLNGSLGGQLSLPVNTKIPTSKAFSIVYTEKEDKQTTGELGGQLLYPNSSAPFGFGGSLEAHANKEFEIKA